MQIPGSVCKQIDQIKYGDGKTLIWQYVIVTCGPKQDGVESISPLVPCPYDCQVRKFCCKRASSAPALAAHDLFHSD